MSDLDRAAVTPEELDRIGRRADEAMSKIATAMDGLGAVTGRALRPGAGSRPP
ncbi:hypothetical protein AB0K16_27420 [Nonomuraea jabiensis]|uniref:hypothetical protein n=1 Tax=Nonomuraea jabiensis TaxID=882448 RepID=UPI00341350CA